MTNQHQPDGTNDKTGGNTAPAVIFNIEDYRHHLDGTALSASEADEFLTTLWNMLCQCTEFGFGTHPFQQITDDGITELSVLDALCVAATTTQEGGE